MRLIFIVSVFMCLHSPVLYSQLEQLNGPLGLTAQRIFICDSSLYRATSNGIIYHSQIDSEKINNIICIPENRPSIRSIFHFKEYVFVLTERFLYRKLNSEIEFVRLDSSAFRYITHNNQTIYAATGGSQILFSNDNGDNWTLMGTVDGSIQGLQIADSILFAGLYGNNGKRGPIFRNVRSGSPWILNTEGLGNNSSGMSIINIYFSDGRVYLCGFGGLYVSENYGNTWQPLLKMDEYRAAEELVVCENSLIVNTFDGTFKKSNNEKDWRRILDRTRSITNLNNNNIVYAIIENRDKTAGKTYLNTFKSENEGTDWSMLYDSVPNLGTYLLGLNNGNVIVTTDKYDKVLMSNNNGNSWDTIFNKVPDLCFTSDSTIYIFDSVYMYYSNNKGSQWLKIQLVPNPTKYYSVLKKGDNLYIGTALYGIIKYDLPTQKISFVNEGISYPYISKIFSHDNFIFLISDKIYRTDNGGESWKKLDYPSNDNLFFVPGGKQLKCISKNMIGISNDNGDNWSYFSMMDKGRIKAIDYNKEQAIILTDSGIFVSPFQDCINWYKVNDRILNNSCDNAFLEFNSIVSNDSSFFIGTSNNSVVKGSYSLLNSIGNIEVYLENWTYCQGGMIKINVKKNGTFNTDNQFFVELSDSEGRFESLLLSDKIDIKNDDTIQIQVPFSANESNKYKIRLRSTSPPANFPSLNYIDINVKNIPPSKIIGADSVEQDQIYIFKSEFESGVKYNWSIENLDGSAYFVDTSEHISLVRFTKPGQVNIILNSQGPQCYSSYSKKITINSVLTVNNYEKNSRVAFNYDYTSDKITLTRKDELSKVEEIEVLNLLGQKMLTIIPDNTARYFEIDTSEFMSGFYLVRAFYKDQVFIDKFLK